MNGSDREPTSGWLVRDEAARQYVAEATGAVRSLVESTYGPAGADTLVQTVDPQGEPETVVTNDAGVLFDAIERGDGFVHPIAALFVDGLDSMRRGLHDGTTTTALLASGLVAEGVELVDGGVRPGTIAVGYAMAANRAGTVLDELSRPVGSGDRERLARVAATTMTANLDTRRREMTADAVASIVSALADSSADGWVDTDDVTVRTRAGSALDLHRGQIVKRRPGSHETSERSRLEFDWTPAVEGVRTDATVAVLERAIDVEETATSFGSDGGAGVTLDSAAAVTTYTEQREAAIDAVADRLVSLGVDVLVTKPELDEAVTSTLESRGVVVVDRVQYPKSDIYRVADATGARAVGHVDDLDASKLGRAGRVYERVEGDEKWAYFDECDGAVFTLVVGAETAQSRRLLGRFVEDAVETTAVAAIDGQVLPGAGAAPLAVAADLRRYATRIGGREQLAVAAFADVCESLATTLATNAGYDPLDARAALRTAHDGAGGEEGAPAPIGVDVESGEPADAWEMGVVEPRRVLSQALDSAVAAAEQLLTVDAVVSPGIDLGELDPNTEHD